jgi:hypothetical protein
MNPKFSQPEFIQCDSPPARGGVAAPAAEISYYVLAAADYAYTHTPNNRWYQLLSAAEILSEYENSHAYTTGQRCKFTATVSYGDPSRTEPLVIRMTAIDDFTSPSSGLPTTAQVTFDECWVGDRVNLASGEQDLRNFLPLIAAGSTTPDFVSTSEAETIVVASRNITLRHFRLTSSMYLGSLTERSLHPFTTSLDVPRIGAVFK